jgi:hypothetical protein
MLTNHEIVARVESAFEPLRCVVELTDYGQKLRFRVLDAKDRKVLRVRSVVHDVRDEVQLTHVLRLARCRVRARGFTLRKYDGNRGADTPA